MDPELDRIKMEYARRESDPRYAQLYDADDSASMALVAERSAAARALLARPFPDGLGSARLVDIGCGFGGEIRRLVSWGIRIEDSIGVDLLVERLHDQHAAQPPLLLAVASAGDLPFRTSVFDLALLFTVLSSVLEEGLRREIASEVDRVLRPGGALLWYDFRWNPTNMQTVGIGPRQIRELFPEFEHETRRVTLAPPIARAVTGRWPRLADALTRIPLLRSHTIGIAIKPGGS